MLINKQRKNNLLNSKMEGHRPTEAELTGFNIEYKKTNNGATHKSKIEVKHSRSYHFFHLLNLCFIGSWKH